MTNNLNARDNVDYTLVLLPFFAEMCTKPAELEKITKLRKEAIWQLYRQLAEYKQRGYIESLLSSIAKKKAGMIMNVTSKTEMEKLMNPRPPYFDGNRFIPDEYHIPEEELIAWSETSFLGPLNEAGYRRYKELFAQVFPEQAKEIFGGE